MAVMQGPAKNPAGLALQEDGIWLKKIMDLIPRSVFGEDSEKRAQENAKGILLKKKRASKGLNRAQTTGGDDVASSRQAGLRKKLHEKIMEKRADRKADDESFIEARSAKKRKREEKASLVPREGKKARSEKESVKKNKRKAASLEVEESEGADTRKKKSEGDDEVHSFSLETTRISGFETDKPLRKAKRRKLRGAKLFELQKKLQEVTEENGLQNFGKETKKTKQNVMDGKEADAGGAMADEKRKQEIEKAMQRAQGIEVRDDAKKLRKSIRREKRKTEKSREEWAKRKESQEMERKAKQEKKAKNLEERKAKKRSTKK